MSQLTHPQSSLDQIITDWSLLQSKFYQAWSAGTLKREALARYAREYGSFISLIAQGWEVIGKGEIASEEREHFELWKCFAEGVGETVAHPTQPGMKQIVDTAQRLFQSPESALGALYAFEAQQPYTSSSKLKGLFEHYSEVQGNALTYFEIHQSDFEEPELLRNCIQELPIATQQKSAKACEEMCRALRQGLDSLYDEYHQGAMC